MRGAASAYNDNKSLQGSGNTTNNLLGGLPKGAMIAIIAVVAVIIIGGIIMGVLHAEHHKNQQRIAAKSIRDGSTSHGEAACHVAGALSRTKLGPQALPRGCDPDRMPLKKIGVAQMAVQATADMAQQGGGVPTQARVPVRPGQTGKIPRRPAMVPIVTQVKRGYFTN